MVLVQRYKEEMQKRKLLQREKLQQQQALDANMQRSRLRTVGGIISAKDRVAVARTQRTAAGGRDRTPSTEEGKDGTNTDTSIFNTDYRQFIEEYLASVEPPKTSLTAANRRGVRANNPLSSPPRSGLQSSSTQEEWNKALAELKVLQSGDCSLRVLFVDL